MRISHLDVEHGPRLKAEHRSTRLQRFDLWKQGVLAPVDIGEGLPQAELGATNRFQLFLGS